MTATVKYSEGQVVNGEIQVVQIKTINPLNCPYYIIMGEHYRDDGSCRCNDQSHSAMTAWGYRWNKKKGQWTA